MPTPPPAQLALSKQLKAGTRGDHDSVDTLVMQARPFESLERYGYFLRLQHRFHAVSYTHLTLPTKRIV